MREGTIYRDFVDRKGRPVTLRAPKWSDVDGLLALFNGIVDEGGDILMGTRSTRESELDFVSRLLTNVEKDRTISVVAESDGDVVGHADVWRGAGFSDHVGTLGILVTSTHRDAGIGRELMLEAESQARRIGFEVMKLEVYARNARAIHLYEGVGYATVGRLPKEIKRDGGYLEAMIMVKNLTP